MTTEPMNQEVEVAQRAVEQAEAQLRIAREAAAQAAEAARQVERQARAEKEREVRQALFDAKLKELKEVCQPAIANAESRGLLVHTPEQSNYGTDCSISFYLLEGGAKKRLCHVERFLGAVVLTDGDYQTSRFPRHKDGTYNVERINTRIVAAIRLTLDQMAAKAKAKTAEQVFKDKYCGLLEAIKDELHLNEARVEFQPSYPGSKHSRSSSARCTLAILPAGNKPPWNLTINKQHGNQVWVELHGFIDGDDIDTPLALAKILL